MDRIFENTYVRRSFFFAFGAILVAYTVLRLWLSSYPGAHTFLELADKFAMSLLVSVLLGGFLFYVTPRVLESRQLELVPASDLKALFRSQIESSRSWTFKGATGRFVRSQVIPRFVERSGQQRQPLTIRLILLDVSNLLACRAYAAYRNGTEPGRGEWSVARVRQEVCATVLVAMSSATAFVQIEVALTSSFSSFRADISDGVVIITKEDPSSSALVCDRNNPYYDSFSLDARIAQDQARPIQLPRMGTLDLASMTIEQVRTVLRDIQLLPDDGTDDFLNATLRTARERRNPYAA